MTTPAENRRRLAEMRAVPSRKFFKKGKGSWQGEDHLLSPEDMLYAAKLHRPNDPPASGRKANSHRMGRTRKPGQTAPIRVNKLG